MTVIKTRSNITRKGPRDTPGGDSSKNMPEGDCNNNKNKLGDDYKEKVPTASENRYTTVQKSYMTFDIHKFVYD